MPANVESMFSVRQMPWHREGTVLAEYPGSWAEARKEAGLMWEPVPAPVFNAAGQLIPGFNQIVRSDTQAVLDIKPDTFKIINHADMGEIVEAVLAQPNVKYETAGVLEGGKSVWCLALLDEPIELPGDRSVTLPYFAITNRHAGRGPRLHPAVNRRADRVRQHLPRRRDGRRPHRGDVQFPAPGRLAQPPGRGPGRGARCPRRDQGVR